MESSTPDSSLLVRLIHVGAPKVLRCQMSRVQQVHYTSLQVLIAIVLMLMWSPNFPKSRFDFLDLFAGAANASEFWCLAST